MRLRTAVTSPQPATSPRKRGSWGRFIYLLLLLSLILAAARWGIRYFSIISAPGVIEGKRVILEASLAGKIERMDIRIGDKVNAGEGLIFLDTQGLRYQIKQQQSELQALKVARDTEQERLPLLLEEENNKLQLKQNAIQQDRQRLMGEIRQLQLKLTQLNNQLAEQKQLLVDARQLLQLGAITQAQFRDIKLKVQELKDNISRTTLRVQTYKQELVHIQRTLYLIEQNRGSLPQYINGKSSLAVFEAKLAAASQQLTLLQGLFSERALSSPLSGIVAQIFKQAGEVVMPGEAIVEIVDPTSIYVQAFFDPKHQPQLAKGNTLRLLFDNQRISQGIIHKFYPATNPLPPQFQQTYQPHKLALIAEIHPLNHQEWPLTIGMGVTVQKRRWP